MLLFPVPYLSEENQGCEGGAEGCYRAQWEFRYDEGAFAVCAVVVEGSFAWFGVSS